MTKIQHYQSKFEYPRNPENYEDTLFHSTDSDTFYTYDLEHTEIWELDGLHTEVHYKLYIPAIVETTDNIRYNVFPNPPKND